MRLMENLVLPLVAAVAAMAPFEFAQSSSCNDTSRVLEIAAGVSETSVSCSVWTIEVMGISFTSPVSCLSSKTIRDDDTFGCAGQAQNVNCDPRSFVVNVTVKDNECPTIPATLPQSLDEVNAVISCKRLVTVNEVQTWSAGTTACVQVPPPGGGSQPFTSSRGTRRVEGSIESLVPAEPVNIVGFAERILVPVEELSDMPVELAQAVQSHGSVPGVDRLEASVAFDFLRSNGEYVRNDHFLRGLVAADGQFRLIDTRPVLREGDPVLLQETLVFDRRLFCSGKEGSRFYHAYPTRSDAFASAMATETQQIGPLLEWVRAPFLVSRVPGTCWEVHQEVAAVAGSPRIRVVETYGDVQSSYPLLGRTEYVLELAATWHPVAIESYSESGRLTESIELSDYREIQPGTWRPFAVTVREHTETATAPTFVSRLRIDRTTVLDEVPGRNEIALLESPTGRWIVHD